MRAINHFGAYFTVDSPITGINLKDFGPKVIIGETKVIAKQFPHRLACQSEFLKFLFGIVLSGNQTIDLA